MISIALFKNLLLAALSSYVIGQHISPDTAQMLIGVLLGAVIAIGVLSLIYAGRYAPTEYAMQPIRSSRPLRSVGAMA